MTSSIARSGLDNRPATRTGSSGKAARSREEIETGVRSQQGRDLRALQPRLRERPDLQGKLVLEFTIAPSGRGDHVPPGLERAHDPELESKIVLRVKLFRFEAKDVETITTTKPIDFFPA